MIDPLFPSSIDQRIESTCPAGYKPSSGTKEACTDVDECTEQLHSCEADEQCINEIGSYKYVSRSCVYIKGIL